MQPNSQKGPATNRPAKGVEEASTPGISLTIPRAMILEDHPVISAALEHLLLREGYEVELLAEGSSTEPGPALLLASARDRSGLYVCKVRNAVEALDKLFKGELLKDTYAQTEGIRAFVPIPFGSKDVLRVVRAVGEFGIRESPRR